MKLGDPKGKKEISKAFRELEQFGFKVWNFSSNKRLNAGMKDYVDYVVIGRGKEHKIELKLTGDKFSDGQLETKEKILEIGKPVYYHEATEHNYKAIIDLILSGL